MGHPGRDWTLDDPLADGYNLIDSTGPFLEESAANDPQDLVPASLHIGVGLGFKIEAQ